MRMVFIRLSSCSLPEKQNVPQVGRGKYQGSLSSRPSNGAGLPAPTDKSGLVFQALTLHHFLFFHQFASQLIELLIAGQQQHAGNLTAAIEKHNYSVDMLYS